MPLCKFAQVLLTYPQCTRSKEELLEFIKGLDDAQCAIVCKENHHETEGEHLHAWVKFRHQKEVAKSVWGSMFNWDDIHGDYRKVTCSTRSIADTVKYVMKDGDTLVWNCDPDQLMNPGKSHKRKYDNEVILNTPLKKLVDDNVISVKDIDAYKRGIAAYRLLEVPKEKKFCRGIWLTGPAGCGKSTWARALGKAKGGYYEKAQNKWWDGYEGQKVVILDDLDTEALLHYLKIWADKFPCKGEVKGATVWLHHDWFVVTSNFSIAEICRQAGLDKEDKFYGPVKRRFHELNLPINAEYFQFDPEAKFENPDVEEDVPLEAEGGQAADVSPSEEHASPSDDPTPVFPGEYDFRH